MSRDTNEKFPKDWHRAGLDPRWGFEELRKHNNNNKGNNELFKRNNRSGSSS